MDHILLETTGLADPAPLVSVLWLDDQLESSIRLDSIITVSSPMSYFFVFLCLISCQPTTVILWDVENIVANCMHKILCSFFFTFPILIVIYKFCKLYPVVALKSQSKISHHIGHFLIWFSYLSTGHWCKKFQGSDWWAQKLLLIPWSISSNCICGNLSFVSLLLLL